MKLNTLIYRGEEFTTSLMEVSKTPLPRVSLSLFLSGEHKCKKTQCTWIWWEKIKEWGKRRTMKQKHQIGEKFTRELNLVSERAWQEEKESKVTVFSRPFHWRWYFLLLHHHLLHLILHLLSYSFLRHMHVYYMLNTSNNTILCRHAIIKWKLWHKIMRVCDIWVCCY